MGASLCGGRPAWWDQCERVGTPVYRNQRAGRVLQSVDNNVLDLYCSQDHHSFSLENNNVWRIVRVCH